MENMDKSVLNKEEERVRKPSFELWNGKQSEQRTLWE
jgi:hypothetical protein